MWQYNYIALLVLWWLVSSQSSSLVLWSTLWRVWTTSEWKGWHSNCYRKHKMETVRTTCTTRGGVHLIYSPWKIRLQFLPNGLPPACPKSVNNPTTPPYNSTLQLHPILAVHQNPSFTSPLCNPMYPWLARPNPKPPMDMAVSGLHLWSYTDWRLSTRIYTKLYFLYMYSSP